MRLIDADALTSEIQKYASEPVKLRDRRWDARCKAIIADMIGTVKTMPTIGGWISVKKKLPEEHESIFHKFLGTPMWSSAMWKQESDKVLVCVSFPDGTSVVTTGCLHDSAWVTTISRTLPQTVTHWMPLPEPPKEDDDEHND